MVKAFYEETPFPNYDDLDSRESLIAKSRQGLFAAALDEQLPDRAIVLEAGCGKLEEKLRAAAPGFDWDHRSLFSEHHLSHAASAFFSSPFEHAVILTMDGVGEWAATSAGMGDQNRITMLKEIHFPHSLGLLYSAFTYFTGFRVNSRECKVMGLAPYGEPRFAQTILDHLIDLKDGGSSRPTKRTEPYRCG